MNNHVCTICLTPINENDTTLTLECNHEFHQKCAINWFRTPQSSGNCPLCLHNPHKKTRDRPYYYVYNSNARLINMRYKKIEKYMEKQLKNNKLTNKELTEFTKHHDKLIKLENDKNIYQEKCKKLDNDEIKQILKDRRKLRSDMHKLSLKIQVEKCKVLAKYPILIE